MSTAPSEKPVISVSPQIKQQIEDGARGLNLSEEAYVEYLLLRAQHGSDDGARLDRHVREVFGKHGELIRRLAQ